MTLLIYIIKTILISGLLLAYYSLFLRNRAFHEFNRYFLLSVPLLSFALPTLRFNMPEFWTGSALGSSVRLLGVGQGKWEEAFTIYGGQSDGRILTWESGILIFVLIISLFLSIRLLRSIHTLLALRKGKPFLNLPLATVYFVSTKGTPFSFFRSIFWGNDIELSSAAGQQILRHELFHVKQKHSLDLLIMEILSVCFWFNPFLFLVRREIRAIHEYGADAYAVAGTDSYEYASLLVMNCAGNPLSFTNPFFKNQIKRRIKMIMKSQPNKKGLLGRLMILPLLAFLICLFSFKIRHPFPLLNGKSIRVVVDAGHGGSFSGAVSGGLIEKNINLLIAKKIQSLSGEYNVDVIMSRETDVTPGSNELKESLEYIAALPKNKDADLFISIHTNSTENTQAGKLQNDKSGFQIYVPRNTSTVYENSVKLGSIITEEIRSDYRIESELKQPPGDGGNILILKKATVPALLIECGYLDNPEDQKYLLDEKNQEKIARDILKGIHGYASRQITLLKFLPGNIEPAQDTTYKEVEVLSEYPGGQAAWYNYLITNLKYPNEAVKNKIQGTVEVEFVVRADGSLTEIKAVSGPETLRAESVRVLKESGKWIPAKYKGKVVDSYSKQPFIYKLEKKS